MKKRTIIFLALLYLLPTIVFGQVDENDLYFFYGVGGEMFNIFTGKEIDAIHLPLDQQLSRVHQMLGEQTDMTIIGHSLGGLRALSYAGYLNNISEANRIDTIIAIGAPATGLSYLLVGSNIVKNRIDEAADILKNGYAAIYKLKENALFDKLHINDMIDIDKPDSESGVNGLCQTFGLDGSGITYLLDSLEDSNSSVRDMMPYSQFIQDYIVDVGVEWITVRIGATTYRVPSTYPKINLQEKNWKLPSNTKYGFIVGDDSDILGIYEELNGGDPSLFDVELLGGTLIDWDAYDVRKIMKNLLKEVEAAWIAAELGHKASYAASLPFSWFSDAHETHWRLMQKCHQEAVNADRAYDWINEYESKYAKILGTTVNGHDCLIPTGNQYIDVEKEFGGRYIDRFTKGKYTGSSDGEPFNHFEEKKDPLIWGPEAGSGMSTKDGKISGGILRQWLGLNQTVEADVVK